MSSNSTNNFDLFPSETIKLGIFMSFIYLVIGMVLCQNIRDKYKVSYNRFEYR